VEARPTFQAGPQSKSAGAGLTAPHPSTTQRELTRRFAQDAPITGHIENSDSPTFSGKVAQVPPEYAKGSGRSCGSHRFGVITILCPDSAELQPRWLDALLRQQKLGVVDLRH
jgi:hypothetical protein